MRSCYHPERYTVDGPYLRAPDGSAFPIICHAYLRNGSGGHVVTATDGSSWRLAPMVHAKRQWGAAWLTDAPTAAI